MCDDYDVPVTVLIVDDHAAFRASARTALELDGFDVVGEAADGASGVRLARALEPDLVLLDIALPDTSGFEVAERLATSPSQVILVSSRERRDFGDRVRRSSALGFVSKDELSGAAVHALLDSR
jgi:DNA-binding NarL/FixJ family response regulator